MINAVVEPELVAERLDQLQSISPAPFKRQIVRWAVAMGYGDSPQRVAIALKARDSGGSCPMGRYAAGLLRSAPRTTD